MIAELKIQIELLKLLSSDAALRGGYTDGRDFVYLSPNAFYVIRIPESGFWLDKSKLKHHDSLDRYFTDGLTGEQELSIKHSIPDKKGKLTLIVLGCADFETCIDVKFLKLLSKNGCKLYAKSEKSPIRFALGETVYAACMPVRKN